MEDRKAWLEGDMFRYQDKIERLREKDNQQFLDLKEMLKGLKESAEDMDYELLRMAKNYDKAKKRWKNEVDDMEWDIHLIKNGEDEKRREIADAKKHLQRIKDQNEVQISKLKSDLDEVELEMKKTRFVYENYEREVERWRKEVEEQKDQKTQFLNVPGCKRSRRSICGSHRSNSSWNRSRSRSNSKQPKEKEKPFQRIEKRASKNNKENNILKSNLNTSTDQKQSVNKKRSVNRRGTQILNKKGNSKQKLKIKRPKSGRKMRM
jgi:hypothetical protein